MKNYYYYSFLNVLFVVVVSYWGEYNTERRERSLQLKIWLMVVDVVEVVMSFFFFYWGSVLLLLY